MMNKRFPLLIMLFACFLFSTCSERSGNEKEQFKGIYSLSTENGDEYEVQLAVGENDALLGFYEQFKDSLSQREVIYPEYISEYSVRLRTRFGGHFLEVSGENGKYSGVADLIGDTVQITLEKESSEPGFELKKKAQIEEVKIGLVRPQFPTFKEDGRFYIVGKPSIHDYDVSNIYLIQKSNEGGYQHQKIAFDQDKYRFTGIGLSPDEKTLVASGIENSENHTTGSDLFLIHLKSATQVDRIENLGGIVNTPSYEIFPAFSPEGDILYSSGGNPAGQEVKGRADLFIARKTEDGYTPELIDDDLNTDLGDASLFMDHQGRFMIFYRKSPGGDYINYISEKPGDGWSAPLQLTGTMENVSAYGLRVDRRGNHLYFTSFFQGPGKLFRVPTADIPEFKLFYN